MFPQCYNLFLDVLSHFLCCSIYILQELAFCHHQKRKGKDLDLQQMQLSLSNQPNSSSLCLVAMEVWEIK
ncbi:hypothetical protein RJT34_03325 [Clitoria ternatea]|uniref:Uncharacterized protein n=1 Tax=Clitoria ternatea TaxID=43366 RepID=A0AAN9KM07_CLITE